MTVYSQSHFEINHLRKTKPVRKHLGEVVKKNILARSGSKRMASLWHKCGVNTAFLNSAKFAYGRCRERLFLLLAQSPGPEKGIGLS